MPASQGVHVPQIPPHLHERYGIRPTSPWRYLWSGIAVLLVTFVAVYFVARFAATRNAAAAVIAWSFDDNQRVALTIDANPDPSDRWCAVRAQSFDKVDVGFVLLPITAGADRLTYTMQVLARPVSVEVVGCNADPRRIAGPQFDPGVLPPAQAAPGMTPGVWQ